MKVLTFSKHFPKGHPKEGQPTYFVEQILNAILPRGENGIINRDDIRPEVLPHINDFVLLDGTTYKHHTIRGGSRWKPGDMASLRIWSDKPYRSKQIEFAQVEVKRTFKFNLYPIKDQGEVLIKGFLDGNLIQTELATSIAKNDGLTIEDFESWFCPEGTKFILGMPIFTGQIICWSEAIEYGKPSSINEKINA